jgi:hypothetical protein
MNPFEASFPTEAPEEAASPFPDSDGEYEKVEEVSLEQLLEGRERPATMSGNIAIPVLEEPAEVLEEVEEVEELEPAIAVLEPEDVPEPVASADTAALVDEVAQLRAEVDAMREEQRRIVESLQRVVTELTSLLRG